MKKTITKIALFTVLIFTIFNCSSDDDSGQGQESETNFMSAKIDGEDFFTDFPIYLSSTEQIIAVSGQNDQNTINIQISIFNYTGPGTYTIDNNNPNENVISIIADGGVWLTDENSGSGTVAFIKEGRFLKGTFSFNAVNGLDGTTKNITEGEFNVQIEFH